MVERRGSSNAPMDGSTTGQAYQELRRLILQNILAPGERINIDALARQLGVSQTPVREALRRLEGDDLISRIPGLGYRTAPLIDLSRLRDMFEFRLLIEQWAVREVARNRLTNPAAVLKAQIKAFKAEIVGESDVRHILVTHDTVFHGTILTALDNSVIKATYEQTHCHFHSFRLYPADTDGAFTILEHLKIAQAIEDCDGAAAETAVREHLINAYQRFAQYFERDAPSLRPPRESKLY